MVECLLCLTIAFVMGFIWKDISGLPVVKSATIITLFLLLFTYCAYNIMF